MSWEQLQPLFTNLQNQQNQPHLRTLDHQNGAVPMSHMSIYDGPRGAWTVNNGAVTFDDGSGQSVPVGFPGQFPGNTGYTNGQWNPNFMTGFPMNNTLPINKMGGGMPDAISGTLPPVQPVGPQTETPTVGSLPPDPNDPNNMRGGTEGAEAHHDRVKNMSEDFYRNNPNHWMSKIDAKLRKMMGMPPLSRTTMFPFRKSPQETARVRRAMAAKQAEIMSRGGDRDVPEGGFSPGAAIDVSQDTGDKPF